ncbi:3-octaprenyl-4-hydroxybenzoate decarboxylase [Roseiarcus fermentans]|uniref:3-octaprenyl-4-hydroxybenzoate decarboxylase n=1 Tax=Roseiarcus fermentans TaxID=1473586 RepID=A0A366FC80_9HYPH|nr:UbiD family decarboxylase [Roseiarcus fermentans]RBP12272.1 3-octaprenyl-4-hydroxybenzoate decarboxylase [Roseiarcus fermentans]
MSFRDLPPFHDLRAFVRFLTERRLLVRIREPIGLVHELTEVHRRVIAAGGPALMFDNAEGATMPVLANLFGTAERVAAGFGVAPSRIVELGEMLAALREPQPFDGLQDALSRWPMVRAALSTRPSLVSRPDCQAERRLGRDVDLGRLPIQTCWPGEPAPLITWGLVITRPPDTEADDTAHMNIGVYRMQVLDKDRVVMRWLAHRGGAAHHRAWAARGQDTPVAVAIGCDPATILSAVLPLPETVSELRFSGVIRGERPRIAPALTVPLMAPADAEIVLEGHVSATETAPEGPYGDHTGYYNSVESFPVMRITAITSRRDPIYLTTFTGRPPDEPSVIGAVLNDLALPTMRRQMPEIVDCWLPPEACSYRMAIISIRKSYPGQARRVMMGLWGMLPQFNYTKTIIVVDDDIDVRSWTDVAWALATRMDASRDTVVVSNTPIDYLDFASPDSGLGGKLGLDATKKIGTETTREWGRTLAMSPEVGKRVDAMWPKLLRTIGGGPG